MRNRRLIYIFILAMGLLLLLLSSSSSSRPEPPFEAIFCPESWEYLWGAGSTDMKGNCAACGKYPVELRVGVAEWWWCAREGQWRETPCADSAARSCCAREESPALAEFFGPEGFAAWYCPRDRTFRTFGLAILGTRVCANCGRPAVKVHAAKRTWFWCDSEGIWALEACSMNPVRRCCVKREGLLLAMPRSGPFAAK